MTDLLDRTLGERITVVTSLAPGSCTVEADRAQLESALLNIAVNARDAMPEGGRLDISSAPVVDPEKGEMIALSVSDSGTGMDEDTLGRAFLKPLLATMISPPAADKAGPALASMSIYLLMAAVLFFRPEGLFPARSRS